MDSMHYEYFLRRVYHCGRDHRKGADSDIYKKMERAENDLNSAYSSKTQELKERDYLAAFASVRIFVKNAVRDGFEQIQFSTSTLETEKLESMIYSLRNLGFHDKKILDEFINSANAIFCRHGLEAK